MNVLDRYIGSNGEVLLPLSQETDNITNLISSDGAVYLIQYHSDEVPTIVAGNPIGLLLILTYSTTP
jgi:hypothetical protein